MAEIERLRDGYRHFVEHEAAGRSELYAAYGAGVAEDDELLDWLDGLPVGKRQPNLVFAAARVVGGTPPDFAGMRALLTDRREEVEAVLLARRTQTNEPARCATLLPALAALPQPLALLEVGASAGLCLLPDRYAYDYGGGRRLGDGGPLLRCRVNERTPVPARLPEVVWRAGLDIDPVDVHDAERTAWLEACVWPGEGNRLETLRAALDVARADPPRLVAGDLRNDHDLPALAAEAPPDATLVIFHTAVLAYIPREGRARFREMVEGLNATWIANEAPRILDVDASGYPASWFAVAQDGVPIAHVDSHGTEARWR
jgi:hypothetical protein